MSAIIPDNMLLSDLLKATGYDCPEELKGKTFAEATSGIGGLKYHLYAWDYAGGTSIAYSEKETPAAGDIVFLKEDMEAGKITDTADLKLMYHVVSDVDGVITVSEHAEGQTGGYIFNRNPDDDYEETITDVRDVTTLSANGLFVTQKGTVLKGITVAVGS